MSDFTVTVLGSSGMFATRERASSGYLLKIGEANVWVDCGGGSWRNLLGRIGYPDIHGILVSHRHPDHTIDLFQAFHARMYGQADPLPPIPLWAPEEAVEKLTAFYPEISNSFDIKAIGEGDEVDVYGASVKFFRMAHPPETLGMRFSYEDRVFAYSADTGPSADLASLAGGADLFACEATLQAADEEWEGHMTAAQAGSAGADAMVGRLLLTHLPPGRDLGLTIAQAEKTAGGTEVQLAADGLHIDVMDING